MRNRIFAVLAIAILAGGGLAWGTYNVMQGQPSKTVSVPTQPVVIAAADLQLGSELKKEDLQVINFPMGQAPEGVFSQTNDVIGRGLIVRSSRVSRSCRPSWRRRRPARACRR